MRRLKLLLLLFLFSCTKENSIKEMWAGYLVNPVNGAFCVNPSAKMDTMPVTYTNIIHDDPTGTVGLIPTTRGYHFFYYKYRVQ